MKNELKIALKIGFFTFFLSFFSIFLVSFFFSDSNSFFEFSEKFFKWYLNFKKLNTTFFSILFLVLSVFFFSYFSLKKIFCKIEKHTEWLKNYNHYLAHELRTPISVIFSNLEVLKYGFDEKIIENSKDELKNMENIINVLLTFSESLNIYEKKSLNLENFLKDFINIFFSNEKSKIKIENNEFNFYIETNEVLFKRIIKNLLENALKYTTNWEVFIKIENKKLIFKNKIEKEFSKEDLENFLTKFYRKNYIKKDWYGIWLAMIKEILKFLWYEFSLYCKEKDFFAQIDFSEKN